MFNIGRTGFVRTLKRLSGIKLILNMRHGTRTLAIVTFGHVRYSVSVATRMAQRGDASPLMNLWSRPNLHPANEQ